MKINFNIIGLSLFALSSFIFVSGCASTTQITSTQPSEKIKIDGQPNEWQNKLKYIEGEKCAVGVQNDDKFIYFCFETSDRSTIMKIISLGATVWVEPENGKTLGIEYPLQTMKDKPMQGRPEIQNGQVSQAEDSEMMQNRIYTLLNNQNDLQIVNEDSFPLYSYPITDPLGFQVKLGLNMSKLVYEMRIPYGATSAAPVMVDAFPGELLSLKIETQEPDLSAKRPSGGGVGTGMGSGGGMRGGGGMGGGMRPGGNAPSGDLKSQFKLELEVLLSNN